MSAEARACSAWDEPSTVAAQLCELGQLALGLLNLAQEVSHRIHREYLCQHPAIPLCEGKTYCPDCGMGLIVRWAYLRCSGCSSRRGGHRYLGSARPVHPCCHQCGSRHYTLEYLESPPFFRLHQAFWVVQTERQYIQSAQASQSTRAWMDWSFSAASHQADTSTGASYALMRLAG